MSVLRNFAQYLQNKIQNHQHTTKYSFQFGLHKVTNLLFFFYHFFVHTWAISNFLNHSVCKYLFVHIFTSTRENDPYHLCNCVSYIDTSHTYFYWNDVLWFLAFQLLLSLKYKFIEVFPDSRLLPKYLSQWMTIIDWHAVLPH